MPVKLYRKNNYYVVEYWQEQFIIFYKEQMKIQIFSKGSYTTGPDLGNGCLNTAFHICSCSWSGLYCVDVERSVFKWILLTVLHFLIRPSPPDQGLGLEKMLHNKVMPSTKATYWYCYKHWQKKGP